MGCDIHSIAQVFKNGKWRTVAHRVGGDDRNYDTFAVYANVRNGHGFSGILTGEGWPIISEPRGLPADFEMWREQHHGTWMGEHSHSWLLLSEIQKAWESFSGGTYEKHGIVTRKHYEETLAKGKLPENWCGGKSGQKVIIVTANAIKDGTAGDNYTDVECSWRTPCHDQLHTMRAQIDVLKWLPEEYGIPAEKVRLVFGFDS